MLFDLEPIKQPKRKTEGLRLPNGKYATKQQSEISHLKSELSKAKKLKEYYYSLYIGVLMQLKENRK